MLLGDVIPQAQTETHGATMLQSVSLFFWASLSYIVKLEERIVNFSETSQIMSAIGIFVLIAIVNIPISRALSRTKKGYVFLLPGVLLAIALAFLVIGLLSQNWSRLGYLLISGLAFVGFVAALISSTILFCYLKKKSDNNKTLS